MSQKRGEMVMKRSVPTESAHTPRARQAPRAPRQQADQQPDQRDRPDHLSEAQCGIRCVHPQVVLEARAHLRDLGAYQAMADLFAVLADPTRAQVVHLLLEQDLCSCDLAAILGMSAPRISQHLRVLRAAHIVKTRREGKFVIYSLDDAHVQMLFQLGLAHTGEIANASAASAASAAQLG